MKNKFINIISRLLKTNAHPDFTKLFLEKEGKQLLGRNKINMVYLVVIMVLTFIAIGFANGSLETLREKMSDPFVRFVNIEIPRNKTDQVTSIRYELNADSLAQSTFSYSEVTGYNKVFFPFQSKATDGKSDQYICSGRTIQINDPILSVILDKENLIKGRGFSDKQEFGLIVTHEMLTKKLNYPEDILYLPYSYAKDVTTLLPVIAVVKKLPGMNEFAVTPYFYSQWRLSASNPFNPVFTKDIILFSSSDSATTYKIRNNIESIIQDDTLFLRYYPELDIVKNNDTYKHGYDIIISFLPKPPESSRKAMSKKLFSGDRLTPFNLTQIFRFNPTANTNFGKFDYLTIRFSSLDHIDAFSNYFDKKHGIKFDMAQIKSMENYNFVTWITRIISSLLIIFSILSICLFVGNLLSKHLERIHMNIGTFKAFGIDNKTLYNIYLLLVNMFIILSTVISLIISWVFGFSGVVRFLLHIFVTKLDESSNYFKLFDLWTLIAIILTLTISYFVLRIKARRILHQTPGDLIYSRL